MKKHNTDIFKHVDLSGSLAVLINSKERRYKATIYGFLDSVKQVFDLLLITKSGFARLSRFVSEVLCILGSTAQKNMSLSILIKVLMTREFDS